MDGVELQGLLAKESFDKFKMYLSSILGQRVKSNTVANLSRLCANLLECAFENFLLHLIFIVKEI